MSLNLNSRSSIENYVYAAQRDAGEYLGKKAEEATLQLLERENRFNLGYRPHATYIYRDTTVCFCPSAYPAPAPAYRVGRRDEKEKEEDRAATACVIGTVITVVGAFLFGRAYETYAAQSEKLSYTNGVLESLDHQFVQPGLEPIKGRVKDLVKEQNALDQLNYAKVRNYAIAAFAVLAGGIALLCGGLAVVSALITIGIIGVVAGAAFAAFNLATHWNDEEKIKKHYDNVIQIGNDIGFKLQCFNERMELFQPIPQPGGYGINPPGFVYLYPNPAHA
jgi:hypothetical protein